MAGESTLPTTFWIYHYQTFDLDDLPVLHDLCHIDKSPAPFSFELVHHGMIFNIFSVRLISKCRRKVTIDHIWFHAITPNGRLFGDENNVGYLNGDGDIKNLEFGTEFGWDDFVPSDLKFDFIESKITISMAYSASDEIVAAPKTSPPTWQQDFVKLFESGRNADVSFLVQGERIPAHKLVLESRCAVFDRMLESDMEEGISKVITVTDIEPRIFKELLKFLYAEHQPQIAGKDLLDLLLAADKYGVEVLAQICERKVIADFNRRNYVEALLVADSINRQELKSAAMTFAKINGNWFYESGHWAKLKANPDLLLELFEFCF